MVTHINKIYVLVYTIHFTSFWTTANEKKNQTNTFVYVVKKTLF